MRKFSIELLVPGRLTIMTIQDVADNEQMCIADYKDTCCLVYKPNKLIIGFSKYEGLKFGKRTPFMVNGIWVTDEEQSASSKEVKLNSKDLELEPIFSLS